MTRQPLVSGSFPVGEVTAGPRFTPRPLQDGDAARHVAKGTGSAMWAYRASVIVHAGADSVAARLPAAVTVEPLGESSCRLVAGSDTPQMLAFYLGLLDVDFEVEEPDHHPELVEHLGRLAERYRRAAGA